MEIKAADVKKLREMTGAGLIDCKKALVEAEGDFSKAEKILKELGLAAVAKRSGRSTNNGRVAIAVKDNAAAILEIACETDFVARNTDFIKMGDDLLEMILSNSYTQVVPELEARVNELISTIKENMALKRFTTMTIADNEMVSDYIHGEGSIGVLVKIKAEDAAALSSDKIKEFLFDCALHIAAFNPKYLSKEFVDADYIAEQTEIYTKQVAALGKPQNVVENIVKGKINKHYSEICFLQQPFVKDDKNSVENVLAQLSKEVGTKLSLVGYSYYKVGEEA